MFRQIFATTLLLAAPQAKAEGQWTIGVIGVGTTGTYIGEEETGGIAPLLSYDTDRLHIGLDGVSYDVFASQQASVAVALGYRAAPAFPEDDPLFKGLDRDDAVELGVSAQLDFGDAYVSAGAMADVSDAHGGIEAHAAVGYALAPGAFEIIAEAGARFRDEKLNQYLYGVTAAEATPDRLEYAAQDTTTAFATLSVSHPLTDRLSAIGLVDYESFGRNEDSPLIDTSETVAVGLGLLMSF